jgi:hypothetical protein
LPAAGYHGAIEEDPRDRGYHGKYWSSCANIVLDFYSTNIQISRAVLTFGDSVRCVQATDEVAEL